MTESEIQFLLHDFVNNKGKNVTVDKVSPFLKDPDPINRRIAHELMNGLTGDANYLVKCIPILKDDVEVLWEFLFDYTSELKDPYVISVLILEGLKHIDPVDNYKKAESLVCNWRRLNPYFYTLPDDHDTVIKIKDINLQALPAITNTFSNWILMGVKRPEFLEFDFFPYYLINHPGLKTKLPEYVWKSAKSEIDQYKSNYELGVFSVFEHDIVSANKYFIKASNELSSKGELFKALNLLIKWYESVGKLLRLEPELLLDIEKRLWELINLIYNSKEEKNRKLLVMSHFFYAEISLRLLHTMYFPYSRLFKLSQMFEEKIKELISLPFKLKKKKKDKINLAFLALSINESPAGLICQNFIKKHDKEKFNLFFYDCGMVPDASHLRAKDLKQYATVKTLIPDPDGDKLSDIYNFARQIYNDDIDIIVYQDWLYNTLGHGVCALKPAPIIISLNASGISTGLTEVEYIFDYFNFLANSKLEHTEKLINLPVAFPTVSLNKKERRRKDFNIPEKSVLLYNLSLEEELNNTIFLDTIVKILKQDNEGHFAFSGYLDGKEVLAYFKSKNLLDRVTYLGEYSGREINIANIKMADIYLDNYPVSGGINSYYAMIASKPVVAFKESSNDIGMKKIGSSIVSLFECIARDQDSYIRIVLNLIKSADIRERVGKTLYERAINEFDLNNAIKAHEDFYKGLYNKYYK